MGTKGIITIGVIGLVASLAAVQLPAQATAQTPAQTPAPRPAGGVRELRQVLYDMADAIGMLRTAQEVDRLGSMNYWATGTIVSGGQSCKVVDYKASVNWLLKGMRVDYKCEGSAQRHVEVVRDASAWNETEPGKGGTPAAAVAGERALMLWTLPAGAIKAANQAGAAAKVALEGGKTTVTFPIAALNATMKLTLNADNHIEQVETRVGQTTTVTTFAEYGDWNGADYLSDVFFPKRIVQKRGTATVADLTVTKTNTYNPYVILPVPAGVSAGR